MWGQKAGGKIALVCTHIDEELSFSKISCQMSFDTFLGVSQDGGWVNRWGWAGGGG